jgi:hypothetical protein
MILAGWPHALVMAVLAAAITGTASLLLAAWRTRRLPIAALLTIVLGAGAGGLLAAPQLLPSVELLRQSTRAPGAIDASSAGREGAIHEPGTFFDDLVRDGLSNGVPGLASPVLAVLAVVFTGYGRARAAVLLAVAALALAISFPNHTPLFDWLRHIPLVGEFRFPFRYRLLSMLALAVCAGLGISRIEVRGGRRVTLLATGIAAIAVALQGVPCCCAPRRWQTCSRTNRCAAPAASSLRSPPRASSRSSSQSCGDRRTGDRAATGAPSAPTRSASARGCWPCTTASRSRSRRPAA